MRRVFSLALFVACLHAQESIHFGSVGGRVTDPTGAVVQGAAAAARNVETSVSQTAVTDRDGRFRFAYLKVGKYEIRVTRAGFIDAVRVLTVGAGSAYDLSIELTIGSAETTVDVSAETTALEGARSQLAGTVSQTEVRNVALNGRNFLDLALLIPGVSPTNTGSNQLFAETSAVPGQGLSIASQRNFSNNFVVDGLSANDDAAGLSGAFYGLDTVEEMQVVTSGAQAEFGRALGGFVNVVTKSGTNAVTGELYGYARNQRFNAANPLSNGKLPMTQAQYGASVGGPVVRDRTFYFGNFEQRQLHQSGLTTITPANVALISARLDEVGYQGARVSTGIYPNPVAMTNGFAKLDHQFTRRDTASVRYSLYDVNSRNSRGAGGLNAPSASSDLRDTDHTLAIGNIFALSPRVVNETRGQFASSDLNAEPSDPAGPAVSIAGVATFGRLSGSPTGRKNRLYEAVDNFSIRAGAHTLRAGVDFLYNDNVITFPRAMRGSYSFPSMASFLSGVYNNTGFTQTFGNGVVPQANPNAGLYVQDEWKVTPALTFNSGLRYDLQFMDKIATDTNNISPRVGFAWTPFRARRTVVRGGYGIFYDRVPLRALANALLSSGNTTSLTPGSQVSVSLSPAQTGAPVFPNIIARLPAGVLPNFTTMNDAMQNAYSTQASFEIDQQIGGHATVSAGYQHVRGLHLLVSVNQNAPTCAASGTNNGCRSNPAYGNNNQYSSLADSKYDGVYLSYVQRPVRWGSYRVSYTFSKAWNNAGEFFFSSPIDPGNIWRDWGRSDDDQRHRLVVNGSLVSPVWGVQLSGTVQYYSTLPLNITTGTNTIQGTAARPVVNGDYITRNAGTGPDLFNVNVRVSRAFRLSARLELEALAEAFNALNHRNDLTLNGVFGAGAYPANPARGFGQATAVNDPRSLQFALRFRWRRG